MEQKLLHSESQTPQSNVIKLFLSSLTIFRKKLERSNRAYIYTQA